LRRTLIPAGAALAALFAAGLMGAGEPVIRPPQPRSELTLSVGDYYAGEDVTDWRAFNLAMEDCRRRSCSQLLLPAKRYLFDDPEVPRRAGAHIQFNGLKDVVIDGQGSELVFHHIRGAFTFRDCQRMVLRNFSVDWDVTLASAGDVVMEPGAGKAILVHGDEPVDETTPVAAVTEYDLENLRWKMDAAEVHGPRAIRLLRSRLLHSPDFERLPVGATVVIRHYVYNGHAFDFGGAGNSDLNFEDITVFGCPGHAFVGYGCDRGFRIARTKIVRKPGTSRLVTATADGAHFGANHGDILIEDCEFTLQGDDSVNIHSVWSRIDAAPGAEELLLKSRWFWAVRFDPADEIRLCRRDNLEEYGAAKVVAARRDDARQLYAVTLDSKIAAHAQPGDYVANVTRSSNGFVIRNNYFHDHRARGMLIQAGDGLVEDNRIENVMAAGIQVTTDARTWQEGFGSRNLVIRGNVLRGVNYAMWERGQTGRHMAALNVVVDTETGLGDYPVHRDILIEGNTIEDTPGLAILIASASGVTIRGNRIADANSQPFYFTGAMIDARAQGTIMVTRASDVVITGNSLVLNRPTFGREIYVDPRNTSGIVVEENEGFQ